jgi:hypothetical protein
MIDGHACSCWGLRPVPQRRRPLTVIDGHVYKTSSCLNPLGVFVEVMLLYDDVVARRRRYRRRRRRRCPPSTWLK